MSYFCYGDPNPKKERRHMLDDKFEHSFSPFVFSCVVCNSYKPAHRTNIGFEITTSQKSTSSLKEIPDIICVTFPQLVVANISFETQSSRTNQPIHCREGIWCNVCYWSFHPCCLFTRKKISHTGQHQMNCKQRFVSHKWEKFGENN